MLRPRGNHTLGPEAASSSGQALTEFALTAPLFFMVIFGIIVFGMALFYQQQVTNAAREGARYAAIHSATSRCPTVSNLAPDPGLIPVPNTNNLTCDPPTTRWPKMTAASREKLFGLTRAGLQVTACWSGYWTKNSEGAWAAWDQIAADPVTHAPNEFRECNVRVFGWCPGQTGASTMHVINPRSGADPSCGVGDNRVSIDCTKQFPLTTAADDRASSFAVSNGANANQVTVLTCYAWNPPLAGFLLIPSTHNIVGVVTETLEYQQ
jgi:hypothetical protein